MTTTTDRTPPSPRPTRTVRRSDTARVLTGVCGGLAEYFAVDPVIFRVLFAVLSVFGGVGVFMYLLCWLLIADAGSDTSTLDRWLTAMRVRRIPPWLVVIAVALALWIGWFSWWAPGPTFAPLALFAVVLLVLIYRTDAFTAKPASSDAETGTETDTDSLPTPDAETGWIPPLVVPGTANMSTFQAWISEARAARQVRRTRRRPLRLATVAGLVLTWTALGVVDEVNRVPFVAYLWSGLAIFATSLLIGAVTRRASWSFTIAVAVFVAGLIAFGTNRNSLDDGIGKTTWTPDTLAATQTYRHFAGKGILDVTNLSSGASGARIEVRQAAGELIVRVPTSLNARITAAVHFGDIEVTGGVQPTGRAREVNGSDVKLTIPAGGGTMGPVIDVRLTDGHIRIEQV